jgi:ACT domain-containing protein
MKAVVSVIGRDKKGIIAKVSGRLYDFNINIEDLSQTLMQGYFTMIMLVDLADCTKDFSELQQDLSALGEEIGLEVRIQNREVFEAMHRI